MSFVLHQRRCLHHRFKDVLIEVNVGEEESKFGIRPDEAEDLVRKISCLPHVRIKGFMTSAPYVEDPEEDRECFAKLRDLSVDIALKKIDNVEVINEDALKIEFPKFNKIVSNLPYQISSPITFKFLDYDFDLAVLMYQKEFADRMNGEVGSKNYSRLSAMLYFKCDIKKLTDVSCESFIPKPKVDSTVIRLTPKESKIDKDEFETYSKFTKALFQHRNKKIRNALIDSRHIICNLDKKEMKSRLNKINDDKLEEYLTKRVIVLTPEEILYISKELNPLFND